MMTPALVLVLIVARAVVLWDRPVEWTPTLIAACVGQDALAAVAFLAAETGLNRWRSGRRVIMAMFWIVVMYVAVNTAVARVLPAPLTWPMLRAAGAPIADSIRLHLTASSLGAIALVTGTAVVAVRLGRQAPASWAPMLALSLLLVGVSGSVAAARVETWGLHRNALVTLVVSALPAVDARAVAGDWRRPPFDASPSVDLSSLHGSAEGRNVVVIGLESTAAQYLRLYGAADNVMPRLEELAAHAVVFERTYAVSPDSIRSLWSVMCARSPAFDTDVEAYRAVPCGSVTDVLRARGYHTALFHSGRFGYLGMNAVIRNRGFDTLEDAGHIGGNHESSFGVAEPATVARLLSWIDALHPTDRFLVSYMPVAGHHPYEVSGTGAFGFATDHDRYRSALHAGDAAIGVLVDGLTSRGLLEQTMFVVYGDHGQAFGQHPGNVGHSFYLYEENVRVPFFVAVPGALARAVRSDITASLVDVVPTAFDLLGLPIDARHQGESALGGQPRMALFFTDYGARLVGLRDGRWKFIHDLGTGRSQLFDLGQDPVEQRDRSRDEPARVAAYTQTLKAWSSAQKALLATGD